MSQKSEDAYGHEMYAYWLSLNNPKISPPHEIIEREDGYIEASHSTPKMYFAAYEDWLETEKQAIQQAVGRILDVGCGAGRVGLYLQEKGHEIVGIDSSPLALEVCRLRGFANVHLLSITQISSALGIFDTIVMFGNNFGLFGNPKRARFLLNRFFKITSSHGKILATSNNIYKTENVSHLAYLQYNRQRGRMAGQIRFRVRYHNLKSPYFDYLMVSQDEMAGILKGTGWHITKFFEHSDYPMYTALIEKSR